MKNIVIFLFLVLLFSCSKDDERIPTKEVNLIVNNLGVLENGFNYAAWLRNGNEFTLLQTFNDVNVNQTSKTFSFEESKVNDATGFLITIEQPGNIISPGSTILLSGNFIGNSAQLSYQSSIGDLENSKGMFTLKTPSDDNNSPDINPEFGIWFEVDNEPSLMLPELPNGWVYEGWVVFNGVNVSTSTFKDPTKGDAFNSFSSSGPKPDVPGEDFLNPSIAPDGVSFPGDVTGKTVFISVEPSPDDDPKKPFYIRPLQINGSSNPLVPNVTSNNEMFLNSASFPSGFATK